MKVTTLSPIFVEEMPAHLDSRYIYISIRYRTASHLCACGCGTRVVTPIKPAKWKLKYNGEAIWLSPSIDRSQSPCGSHYWIRRNRVDWYQPLTAAQAKRTRERDARDLHAYYDTRAQTTEIPKPADTEQAAAWWGRLWAHVRRR